jgi:hypothetical protein
MVGGSRWTCGLGRWRCRWPDVGRLDSHDILEREDIMAKRERTHSVEFVVSAEDWRAFKARAAREGKTVHAVIARLVGKYAKGGKRG